MRTNYLFVFSSDYYELSVTLSRIHRSWNTALQQAVSILVLHSEHCENGEYLDIHYLCINQTRSFISWLIFHPTAVFWVIRQKCRIFLVSCAIFRDIHSCPNVPPLRSMNFSRPSSTCEAKRRKTNSKRDIRSLRWRDDPMVLKVLLDRKLIDEPAPAENVKSET